MSKIHVLESDNSYSYRVVIHYPTPPGTNIIGLTWKACALSNGDIGATILNVGTAPGNITQTEYDSIIVGDIVEIVETISPGIAPTNEAVEALTDIIINNWNEDKARILKYYGHKIEAI